MRGHSSHLDTYQIWVLYDKAHCEEQTSKKKKTCIIMRLIQDLDILLGSSVNTNENLFICICLNKTVYLSYLSMYLTYPFTHPSIYMNLKWKLVWIAAQFSTRQHAREWTKWCTKHANHGQCGGEVKTTSSRFRNLWRSHWKPLVHRLRHIRGFRVDHYSFICID